MEEIIIDETKLKEAFLNYIECVTKLKQENEKLKQENEALIKENEDMKKSFVSHSEFMNILENNPNINWEKTAKENIYLINKYCKALEEIREMCNGQVWTIGDDVTIEEIRNKINEVLND